MKASQMTLPDTHLDLGCGARPRNPYGRKQLFGVDIRDIPSTPTFQSRIGNLSLDPIPYADHSFGSVSAFDFIEHVPRILPTAAPPGTRFPFIELMNEIWRVLAPDGRFYAVTPAFPRPEAFQDPTHVNIITERTHEYFCGENPTGRMYGFTGHFEVVRMEWIHPRALEFTGEGYEAERAEALRREAKQRQLHRRLAYVLRESLRFVRGKRPLIGPNPKSHLLWEFRAVKPGA